MQSVKPGYNWPPYHFKYYTPLTIIYENMHTEPAIATNTAEEQEEYSNTTEDINSLFSAYRGCGSYKILIEGEPGIGKTILSSEIAVRWANKTLLNDKTLLFLLFMRQHETDNISNVKSLVEHFFYDDISLVNEITEWLTNSSGSSLTIVLDGYDEAYRYSDFFNFVEKIFMCQILPKCGLVITSRPAESLRLHSHVNCRAEVLGFTEQSRQQFINLYIEKQEKEKQIYQTNKQDQNTEKKIAIIQNLLKDYPIINTLCYIPLNITMLLLCLTESEEETDLPTTTTTLYEKFIIITIKHFLRSKPGFTAPVTGFHNLPKEYYQTFLQLSELAYSVSDSMQLIFESTEIEKSCKKFVTHGSGLGLLKPACFLNMGVQNTSVSYNFLHKSIQEYMAAYHIALLPSGTLLGLLNKRFWDSSYFNIWIMYVGITRGEQKVFKQFLSDNHFRLIRPNPLRISNAILNDKIKCLHLLRCASEAKDSKFLLSIRNIFKEKVIDLSNKPLSETDIKTLAVLLLDLPGGPWTLNLSKCNINNKCCKVLFEIFSSQTVTANIKVVNISFNSIYSENLYRLCHKIFKLWKTEEVILPINALLSSTIIKKIEQFMDTLKDLIQTSKNSGKLMILYVANKTRLIIVYSDVNYLKCFQLYNCEFNEDTATKLKQSITKELKGHKVGHFSFSYSIYDHHDVETLSYIVENFKRIKFCGLNMHSKGAYKFDTASNIVFQVENNSSTCLIDFLAAVIQNDTQQNATSYFDTLPEEVKKETRKILRGISTLKVLDLSSNSMSDCLAVDINIILSCNDLEELYLGGNNLQEAGMIKILEALRKTCNLKVIDISNNKINDNITTLLANKTDVEKVYLNKNHLQDEDFNELSGLQSTSLKIMNVSQNSITNTRTGYQRIANSVQANPHLVELHISHIGGHIFRQGINAILMVLANITTLKVFDISDNNISSEAAGDIACILSKQVNLETLIIGENNFKDGLIVMVKDLKCYPTLRMLDISNNNANTTVIDKVATILCFQTRLEKLYLGGNNLVDIVTLQTLQYFLTQTVFDISCNNLSDEARENNSGVSSRYIVHMQTLLLAYLAVDGPDEFSSLFDDLKQSRIPLLKADLSLKRSIENLMRDGGKFLAMYVLHINHVASNSWSFIMSYIHC